jgi:hypothetical protein
LEIAQGLGVDVDGKTPQGLTNKLKQLIDDGKLTSEGARRWTRYSVKKG